LAVIDRRLIKRNELRLPPTWIMSAIELSLLPDIGRGTVCLPILPVFLRIALASQAQKPKYNISNVAFVQINIVIHIGVTLCQTVGVVMVVRWCPDEILGGGC
jgi:hypothetical protein